VRTFKNLNIKTRFGFLGFYDYLTKMSSAAVTVSLEDLKNGNVSFHFAPQGLSANQIKQEVSPFQP
jgi:hypothetical protein